MDISGLKLGVFLIAGAIIGYYLKYLYLKVSSSVSNTEQIADVFPMLTVITICVISVIKMSLALSLGLVGALSIVRFRAAIKDPEELIWLFLCIAMGLSIGAGHLLYAVILVFVVSLLCLNQYYFRDRKKIKNNLLLTLTGNAEKYFSDSEKGVLLALKEISDIHSIQRYEIDEDRGQVRVVVKKSNLQETTDLISELKERLPDCNISYINMNGIV